MNENGQPTAKTVRPAGAILVIAVALITAAVFSPGLHNQFLNWDDGPYVYDNSRIRSIDLDFLGWAFTTFKMGNYHPLTWLSLAIDQAIWGSDPFGYHLTNLLLHSANAALVVLLILLLFRASDAASGRTSPNLRLYVAAGLTGILFSLHPLRVEAVAWVAERKGLLSAFFFLLSLVFYLQYAFNAPGKKRRAYYALCLASFLFSVLSKPSAVILPLVLLLIDLYPLDRFRTAVPLAGVKRALLEKAPFFLISLCSALAALFANAAAKQEAAGVDFSFLEILLKVCRGIFLYLRNFLAPTGLAPDYPVIVPVMFTSGDIAVLGLLAGITAFCVLAWKRQRIFAIAWLSFLVTLMPLSGIIQIGHHYAADRYTYLSLIGPTALLGIGAALLLEKLLALPRFGRTAAALFALLVAGLVTAASYLTVQQIAVWKDSVALWTREIQVYMNLPTGYLRRAHAYEKRGEYGKAVADYDLALMIDPSDPETCYARGMAHYAAHNYPLAIQDFDRTLAFAPDYLPARQYRELSRKWLEQGTRK